MFVADEILIRLFAFRWDAKKRLSPDDALRHEWLKSSSTSAIPQHPQDVRRSPSESITVQRRGTLPASDSEFQYSMYKLYRGRKSKFGDGDGIEQTEVGGTTKVKVNVTPSARHTSAGEADPNLDDSGTFLPPIL